MKQPWRLRLHMRVIVAGLSVATWALAQSPAPMPDLGFIVALTWNSGSTSSKKLLRNNRSRRHYTVEYRGLPKNLSASMEVEVSYAARFWQEFSDRFQAGSQMLRERVLDYALDSERKASLDSAATALNSKNYRFRFAGEERDGDQKRYLLDVDPVTPNCSRTKGESGSMQLLTP